MVVTVTSVNKEKQTFNAEGIGGGGTALPGRSKAFRLVGVSFAQIEVLLETVKRTRGVGSWAMIRKKRRGNICFRGNAWTFKMYGNFG